MQYMYVMFRNLKNLKFKKFKKWWILKVLKYKNIELKLFFLQIWKFNFL